MLNLKTALLAGAVAFSLPALAQPDARDPDWFAHGRQAVTQRQAIQPIPGPAKNVILVVGDGMGVSTITAGRIFDGQVQGFAGEGHVLSFEAFPHTALIKTYNTNAQVADSAGTATAMLSGVKTKIGMLGVTADVRPGRCDSVDPTRVPTLLELAEVAGLATGVVSTTRITHATPAATYAHVPTRDWEADTNIPESERACADIARQLVEFPYGDGIDLVMGGGRANFLPKGTKGPEGAEGRRGDGRDLTADWQKAHPQGRYVWNADQFAKLDAAADGPVFALFDPSHMDYEADRAQDAGGEPSLPEMVAFAIDKLQRKSDAGFFLLIEGGRIDHAHHGGNAYRALLETKMLADAVRVAREKTDPADTLILVTADHSHTLTIAGYPPRGNPILGLANRIDFETGEPTTEPRIAADGKPYTTLGYYNGPGAPEDGQRRDLGPDDVLMPNFRQPAAVPFGSETHGGEDVALYASGPLAHLVGGTWEQSVIFHLMDRALGDLHDRVCGTARDGANPCR